VNDIGNENIKHICGLLIKNKSIKTLIISGKIILIFLKLIFNKKIKDNNIDVEGVKIFSEVFIKNSTLTELDLKSFIF
jgi:hypothetical protein